MRTFVQLRNHTSLIPSCGLLAIAVVAASGQSPERKNNPYAPSPAGNSRQVVSQAANSVEIASLRKDGSVEGTLTRFEKYRTPDPSISRPESEPSLPTDIYKIGVNDVLRIKLANAAISSAYYIVRADGTIDFPLAGDNVNVKDLTIRDVAEKLRTSIRLFADPQVEVAVTEYASHAIIVSGKVKNPGEKYLRREAVPLFVIKAEAMVEADSNALRITNANGGIETYLLHNAQTDNILIQSGSKLDFISEEVRPPALFFIAGSEKKTLERPFSLGLTLSKVAAMEAANGKKATIHRQDKEGKLIDHDYDLRTIRAGKSADPAIEAGDIIRIRN